MNRFWIISCEVIISFYLGFEVSRFVKVIPTDAIKKAAQVVGRLWDWERRVRPAPPTITKTSGLLAIFPAASWSPASGWAMINPLQPEAVVRKPPSCGVNICVRLFNEG
jgi:hypothetical protein